MGNCFSDPSKAKSKSGGQRLGSRADAAPGQAAGSGGGGGEARPPTSPPRPLGGSVGGDDPRAAALAAAEARANAAPKGVSKLNPKAGQLSAKLAEERRVNKSPQQVPNARMMDAGEWN